MAATGWRWGSTWEPTWSWLRPRTTSWLRSNAVPQGVDRVLVTAPPRTLPQAFEIARFGAIIGLIGIEFGEGAEVSFDVNAFHFKKLQLRASHAIPNHYFPMALDLLARRVVDPDLLVSHTFSLDEYEAVFRTLTDPQQAAVKAVIIL
jgi:L-iditol 2-dehydrogenase